jgi:hypothetical protein
MNMRAKFYVASVKLYPGGPRTVNMNAVHDGSPENNQFAQASPSGSLEMHINNPAAVDFLKPGKSYYLDFSEAPD